MAPVSGAIFLFATTFRLYQRLRQISPNGNPQSQWVCVLAYRIQKWIHSAPEWKGAYRGTALRYGDKQPDRRWNMGASRDFPLLRMANSQLAERSGCRADGPLLQFQPAIDRRRQPPRP